MGWWKYAKPGDKVVCVDAFDINELAGNHVYTVLEVFISDGIYPGVHLAEVKPRGFFNGFRAERFRPTQAKSTETGMAILRKIRDGAPVREYAQ